MSSIAFAVLLGLGSGGLYAMLATGLVTAHRGSGVINFAHGAMAMYAVYTYDELQQSGTLMLPWIDFLPTSGLNVPVEIGLGGPLSDGPAAVVSLLMAAFLGLLAHFLVFRPLRSVPALGKVVGAVGLMLYLQTVAVLNFGTGMRQNPGFLPGTSGLSSYFSNFLGFGRSMPHIIVWIASMGVVLPMATWALFRFSRFGLATRACDENEKGAVLLGYSPQFVAGLNWVISSLLAGITGLLVIGQTSLAVDRLTLLVIPALGAALFGNFSSIPMACMGAFIIGGFQSGMVEVAGQSWWPSWLPAEGVRALVPLLVVVIALWVRGDRIAARGSLLQTRQALAPVTRRAGMGIVVGGLAVFIASNRFTGAWEVSLTSTMIASISMLALVVIVGLVGQISLVQTTLAGVAAFTAVRLASDGSLGPFDLVAVEGPGLPHPLAFVLGVAVAVIVGVAVGLPALRIRGVQLAIVTIASVSPIGLLLLQNPSVMSDAVPGSIRVPDPNWFGVSLSATDPVTNQTDYWHFTAFAFVVLVALGLAVVNLRRGIIGRRFLAVRGNERAAAACRVDVTRTKLLGFAIAAAIAGVAGVLQGYRLGSIGVSNYTVFAGISILAFAYLGGITTVSGAAVGGLLVGGGVVSYAISDLTGSQFNTYVSLIGAVGLILTAITNPEGLATTNTLLAKRLASRRRPGASPSPGSAVNANRGCGA